MILQGKGVSPGIVVGPLRFLKRAHQNAEKRSVDDAAREVARFESARALAAAQLGQLAVDTAEKIGAQNSLLFEIHQMMLEDLDYRDAVTGLIQGESVCAEYAVAETATRFAQNFAGMDDDYMRERAADVRDVSRRVVEILTGRRVEGGEGGEGTAPAILVSDDFAPSETAQFDRAKVLGLATAAGAANSHTAIFARSMGMPAAIGFGKALRPEYEGKPAVLDGEEGRLYVEPDEATLAGLLARREEQRHQRKLLEEFRGKPTLSKSGQRIRLFANIGGPADVDAVLQNGAEGIGLFRSEFLYLERNDFPPEEVQYAAYREVAERMEGRRVIIRTLDIGADKRAPYFGLPVEENPAMGLRALRVCLARPEMFKTQLRALYRASAHGNLAVMFPMVTGVAEVRRAKAMAAEVRRELAAQGVAHVAGMPLGIMVETPAAAILSDLLAKEVDFFSIGTNDLTQYTLAVDRQNDALAEFCDAHHEAVLRLIRTVAQNAHANGIEVGICGELAADEALAKFFLQIGIDELSVAPAHILPLRGKIGTISIPE